MTQTPPDMRDVVENNRGLVKKIELAIPGFRGYRKREDLRIADNMLRIYLADQLARISENVGAAKKNVSKSLELELVKEVGELEEAIHVLDKRLRHTEQGYSVISPDYRIGDAELNALYAYDNNLLGGISALDAVVTELIAAQGDNIGSTIGRANSVVKEFSNVLDDRRNALIGTGGATQ